MEILSIFYREFMQKFGGKGLSSGEKINLIFISFINYLRFETFGFIFAFQFSFFFVRKRESFD